LRVLFALTLIAFLILPYGLASASQEEEQAFDEAIEYLKYGE